MTTSTAALRSGFKLIDLLVALAAVSVIIVLVALKISGSRESTRRIDCENKLRNLFLASETYSLRYGRLPIGTLNPTRPIRSLPEGYHQNWISALLPFAEQESLSEQIDFSVGVYDPANAAPYETTLPELQCAANVLTIPKNASGYAGVNASFERPIDDQGDGMFLLDEPLTRSDAKDGASYVFLVGEAARQLPPVSGWMSGTRATLRNMGHPINAPFPEDAAADPVFVGGFSSNHAGGAYFLFVDGAFQFFSDQSDPLLLRQLAGRDDQDDSQGQATRRGQ